MNAGRLPRKLAISLASLAVFAALTELGLRAAGWAYPVLDPPIVVWNPLEDQKLASQDSLHQESASQLWELRPGARVAEGGDETINTEGWRGPLRPRERAPGTMRVVTLGDSSTFGLGVPYADTWSAGLERELTARGIQAEVLDFGVIGFTVRQGLERWRALAREWRPDVVVAAFGAVNEHHPAIDGDDDVKLARQREKSSRSTQIRRWIRTESRTCHLLARIADDLRGGRDKLRLEWMLAKRREGEIYEMGFERQDWPGVRRVTTARFGECLRELQDEVESSGARLVVISMPRLARFEGRSSALPPYTQALEAFAAAEKVPLVDARGIFRKNLDPGSEVDPNLLPGDPVHPSPSGHALIAAAVAEALSSAVAPGASSDKAPH